MTLQILKKLLIVTIICNEGGGITNLFRHANYYSLFVEALPRWGYTTSNSCTGTHSGGGSCGGGWNDCYHGSKPSWGNPGSSRCSTSYRCSDTPRSSSRRDSRRRRRRFHQLGPDNSNNALAGIDIWIGPWRGRIDSTLHFIDRNEPENDVTMSSNEHIVDSTMTNTEHQSSSNNIGIKYKVSEDSDSGMIHLQIEVPGVSLKEMTVQLEDNNKVLRIKGERRRKKKKQNVSTNDDEAGLETFSHKTKRNIDHVHVLFDESFIFGNDYEIDEKNLKVTLAKGILEYYISTC
jgi:HSP20 family molecular chaperone IbpA